MFLDHRMVRLSMDSLVAEAIEAHKNGEVVEEPVDVPQEVQVKIVCFPIPL